MPVGENSGQSGKVCSRIRGDDFVVEVLSQRISIKGGIAQQFESAAQSLSLRPIERSAPRLQAERNRQVLQGGREGGVPGYSVLFRLPR